LAIEFNDQKEFYTKVSINRHQNEDINKRNDSFIGDEITPNNNNESKAKHNQDAKLTNQT
jgi:hypothetical protein